MSRTLLTEEGWPFGQQGPEPVDRRDGDLCLCNIESSLMSILV